MQLRILASEFVMVLGIGACGGEKLIDVQSIFTSSDDGSAGAPAGLAANI